MTEVVARSESAQPTDVDTAGNEAVDGPFPELLRLQRARAGLTQQALADLSMVSPRTIRSIEAGRTNARIQTVALLADGLRLQGLTREIFVRAGLRKRPIGPFGAEHRPAVPCCANGLLGRERETVAMVEALASGGRRMISIVGLPGVGKTRLAAEVAGRLSQSPGWPVLWLTSAEVTAHEHQIAPDSPVPPLRALLEFGTGSPARVARLIGRRAALVVLDGLADVAVPSGVEELLACGPEIRLISTSRRPWPVEGVQAAVIAPLATPGPDWDTGRSVDALTRVPGVHLLVDRLGEIAPDFALTAANAADVATLARRLDGLPIALEALARRFRVLGLRQLAELSMSDLLDLPVSAGPNGGGATIGDLIGSSVTALRPTGRRILGRLARCDRSWTAADAAALVGLPLEELIDEVSVLIDHGLILTVRDERLTCLQLPNLLRAALLRRDAA